GIVLLEKACDGGLQLFVQLLGAADKADRGHAVAPATESLLCGLDDGRVIRQPEVVVGAEVDDLAPRNADGGALRTLETPLSLEQATSADVVELAAEHVAKLAVAHGDVLVREQRVA